MQTEFKVLDHGFVKYVMSMGTEESIIEAARQSTQKGFLGWGTDKSPVERLKALKNGEPGHYCKCNKGDLVVHTHYQDRSPYSCARCSECKSYDPEIPAVGDEKLLEYLYKNRHTTPFEMCELVVQVKAPIMVLRQWHRHRTFSYNEWSGRYSQLQDEFYVPEIRLQDVKNKQGSHLADPDTFAEENFDWQECLKLEQSNIYENYENYVKRGYAKEIARVNLPVSVYTIMWAKANLHNWLHFLKLRMDSHAQYEIRVYANAVAEIIKSLWPRTYALFENYTLNSRSFSGEEFNLLQMFMRKHFIADNFNGTEEEYKMLCNKLELKW